MAMAAAIGRFFRSQSDRNEMTRVHQYDDDDDDIENRLTPPASPPRRVSPSNSIRNGRDTATTLDMEADNVPGMRVELSDSTEMTSTDAEEEEEEGGGNNAVRAGFVERHRRMLELEEERELARRRTSTCVLVAAFILFRLWVEALVEKDPGMLLVCFVGTSWTARWIRQNREHETELDRQIQEFISGEGNGDMADFRFMSFQAQLAMAIIESQRQMATGNFGHPDGSSPNHVQGLSQVARDRWDRFDYGAPTKPIHMGTSYKSDASPNSLKRRKGGYGSVALSEESSSVKAQEVPHDLKLLEEGNSVDQTNTVDGEGLTTISLEEAPSCSICLCEYEVGDSMVKLPCGHLYHEDCVSAWTQNNVRCPLCNFNLEQCTVTTDEATPGSSDNITQLSVV
jgi:hypothetical protein